MSSHGGILADVEVSDSGQFNATFAIWPASPADDNPTLNGGTLEIKITDAAGFSATAQITILPPTLTVAPDVVGPLHSVHITGANWPVTNPDGGAVSPINIHIDDGVDACATQKAADANGKWYEGYQFMLNASGFLPYNSKIMVNNGPHNNLPVLADAATDGAGRIKDLAITMPGLDAGDYTVQVIVGGDSGAVTMIVEYMPGNAPLPDALESMGDNLVRVFHFDHSDQTWLFYDPRPEFAGLNTLSFLYGGWYYWILVRDSVSITSHSKIYSLTCRNGDCWNRIVW